MNELLTQPYRRAKPNLNYRGVGIVPNPCSESYTYADSGCEYGGEFKKCLDCDLPYCRYDKQAPEIRLMAVSNGTDKAPLCTGQMP